MRHRCRSLAGECQSARFQMTITLNICVRLRVESHAINLHATLCKASPNSKHCLGRREPGEGKHVDSRSLCELIHIEAAPSERTAR